jgi:hypothetical protein
MADQPVHIAAYSVSGHTRDAAERLTRNLGETATYEEIRPSQPPRGFFGYLRMGWGTLSGASWPIETPQPHREGCALLVVGTPIWAGRLPPPVREYLLKAGRSYPTVTALITHGGSSPARVVAMIGEAAGKGVAASVGISDEDRKSDQVGAKIERFAEALRRLP